MSISDFGPLADASSWDIYAFEANPAFNGKLKEIETIVSEKHHIFMYTETAAWTYDGKIEFFLDNINKRKNAATLNKNNPIVEENGYAKEIVKCVDVAKIIKKYKPQDFVVVKIDIQGAEYDLLLDLMVKGVYGIIDLLAVEFHPQVRRFKTPESVFKSIIKSNGVIYVKWLWSLSQNSI